ncbi:MAG: alkaline phosphatase family protein [Thermodesulfobacteriota bacterium]
MVVMDNNHRRKDRVQVIAIGIDVASPELIEKWSMDGHLSTLASLIDRGSWGRVISTSDLSSGSIWPTFFTGVSPAKHGQFFTHMQLINGTYRIDKKYANQVKRDPFWFLMNRTGKRIAVIDVPQTYPLKELNGVQIVGWGAEYPAWKRSSWPPKLIGEIITRFGTHPLGDEYRLSIKPETDREYNDLYKKLISGAEKKGAISTYLLKQQPWDFFLTIFPETHWATHLLWQFLDESHPDYNPEIAKTFKNAFLNLFTVVDSWISKFMEVMPDATFLVFSLSGMGPNYSGWHLLPEVLQRMGMTTDIPNDSGSGIRWLSNLSKGLGGFMPTRKWGSYKIRKVEDSLSLRTIEIAKQIIPRRIWDKWTRQLLYAGNNWKWSRAFCIPNDYAGAIRINLKGREPHGLVEQGEEYNDLCDALIKELSALENPDTEKKAVSEVLRIDKIYHGEYIWDLPDLVVKWAGDAPIKVLYSPRIGTVSGDNPERRAGAHRPYGFLIASGKNISQGKTVERASIMDIAPTILYLMGQPVPRDMDGKVLLDIIDEDFKANSPVSYL